MEPSIINVVKIYIVIGVALIFLVTGLFLFYGQTPKQAEDSVSAMEQNSEPTTQEESLADVTMQAQQAPIEEKEIVTPTPQTPPTPPEKPKTETAGSLVFKKFWEDASRGTVFAGYEWGTSGDDNFYDGGEGSDTLQYLGNRADYQIIRSPLSPSNANSFILVRKISKNTYDIVLNIEFFKFADQMVQAENLFK